MIYKAMIPSSYTPLKYEPRQKYNRNEISPAIRTARRLENIRLSNGLTKRAKVERARGDDENEKNSNNLQK